MSAAMAMKGHAMRKKLRKGEPENEKEHPAMMSEGGLVEGDETFPEQGDDERAEDFLSADMDPETSGLEEAETDTYPTNGTEHEINEDEDKKKFGRAIIGMRSRRAG